MGLSMEFFLPVPVRLIVEEPTGRRGSVLSLGLLLAASWSIEATVVSSVGFVAGRALVLSSFFVAAFSLFSPSRINSAKGSACAS